MASILKDQLVQKFKSKETELLINRKIKKISGNVFVFLSEISALDKNCIYLEEFGCNHIIEEFHEDIIIMFITVDQSFDTLVKEKDVVLMFSNLLKPISNVFLYMNNTKKEVEI